MNYGKEFTKGILKEKPDAGGTAGYVSHTGSHNGCV